MMMQSLNQKANTLASILGIFLHSCRTPQKVINALARMGLSISRTTIHSAINSLSSNMYLSRISSIDGSGLDNIGDGALSLTTAFGAVLENAIKQL